MNNISHIGAARKAPIGGGQPGERTLLDLRQAHGLTKAEAAAGLGIPVALYESWENDAGAGERRPGLVHVENVFTAYVRQHHIANGGHNMIFGAYPLALARALLRLSLAEMAAAYGSTMNTWKKYECNHRLLPKPILDRIEEDVRETFRRICGPESMG